MIESSFLQQKPKLRWPLDVQSTETEGRPVCILSDPQGVAESPAVIPYALMPVVSRFDGATTVGSIVQEGAPYGVTAELVQHIVHDLETMLFLETELSRKRWQGIVEAFQQASVREAALAGAVYPSDSFALQKQLDRYLKPRSPSSLEGEVAAVICPHIDYRRGHETYAATFQALSSTQAPDVIFLLGTAHQPGEGIFHLCKKDFETPLGRVPCDHETVELLAQKFGSYRAFASEILHRKEHSLELQLPFLQAVFPEPKLPKIVPILVGSFHEYIQNRSVPSASSEVGEFVSALGATLQSLRRQGVRAWLYGAIDLAHMGLAFGDTERHSDGQLSEIERRDRELLDCVLHQDSEALFQHIAQDLDRRRICGFPTLYVMLEVFRQIGLETTGQLIEYRQAVDAETDCVVSFAGAVCLQ